MNPRSGFIVIDMIPHFSSLLSFPLLCLYILERKVTDPLIRASLPADFTVAITIASDHVSPTFPQTSFLRGGKKPMSLSSPSKL